MEGKKRKRVSNEMCATPKQTTLYAVIFCVSFTVTCHPFVDMDTLLLFFPGQHLKLTLPAGKCNTNREILGEGDAILF